MAWTVVGEVLGPLYGSLCHAVPWLLPGLSVYSRAVHHLCDAEEPESDQKGSVRAQPGCSRLPFWCTPQAGAHRTGAGTAAPQAWPPPDTPGDGAVQDSPLTDQNPHFSSAHSSRARRKDLEISLSPLSVSGPERYWSSLPHCQTPCHFFLWVLPSCLSFPPASPAHVGMGTF